MLTLLLATTLLHGGLATLCSSIQAIYRDAHCCKDANATVNTSGICSKPTCRQYFSDAPEPHTLQLISHFTEYYNTTFTNATCQCPAMHPVPIWAAPGDLCTVYKLNTTVWPQCDPTTEFASREHVKVCVSSEELQTMFT